MKLESAACRLFQGRDCAQRRSARRTSGLWVFARRFLIHYSTTSFQTGWKSIPTFSPVRTATATMVFCLRVWKRAGPLWSVQVRFFHGRKHLTDYTFAIAECNGRTCARHRIVNHDGLTCDEFDRKNAVTSALPGESEKWIRGNCKQCPKCAKFIQARGKKNLYLLSSQKSLPQKVSGCDSMVCRTPGGCGHQFCWLCFAATNQKHNKSCLYHT